MECRCGVCGTDEILFGQTQMEVIESLRSVISLIPISECKIFMRGRLIDVHYIRFKIKDFLMK